MNFPLLLLRATHLLGVELRMRSERNQILSSPQNLSHAEPIKVVDGGDDNENERDGNNVFVEPTEEESKTSEVDQPKSRESESSKIYLFLSGVNPFDVRFLSFFLFYSNGTISKRNFINISVDKSK